jgi:lambda repressor-like predicted transcriptional regulator
MAKATQMERRLSDLIKAELKERGMSYADLANRLRERGVEATESSVRNKLHRGSFSAAFFAECLLAIGSDRLRLE